MNNMNNVNVTVDEALEAMVIPTVEETIEAFSDDVVFAAPEEKKGGEKKKKSKSKKDYTLGGRLSASTWQEFQSAMKEAGLSIGHKSYEVLKAEYEEIMAQQTQETQEQQIGAPEKVQQEKILSDKDIFYGKGGVKGLLYWSSKNKNSNFISGFILESVVAELLTGKRLMSNGVAVSFTEAERKEVKKVADDFKKKYLKELNGCRGYGYGYNRKKVAYATILTIMGHSGLPSMDALQKYIYFAATGDVMPPKGKEVKQDILDRCKDIQKFLTSWNILVKNGDSWGINTGQARITLADLYNQLGW